MQYTYNAKLGEAFEGYMCVYVCMHRYLFKFVAGGL